ncbi:MAG TPA: hypothetical protein PLW81_15995 [Thiobacillaceae bacterium]|nr:hypothetical protein [Thiobacillaceae bacterium]
MGPYLLAWLPMVAIAIANGWLRQAGYGPYLSELAAHQVSTLTGALMFALYIYWVMRCWPPASARRAWQVGLAWLAMTVAFEFLFGHFVAGHYWTRLLADYDLTAGRVWPLVLLWLLPPPHLLHGRQALPPVVSGDFR